MKNRISEKIGQGLLKICKYAFFDIWKRRSGKKLCLVFLRFVSILFLVFEKGDTTKIGLGFFKICKYTFL